MNAPHCKLCGVSHWSNEAHHFKGVDPIISNLVKNQDTIKLETPTESKPAKFDRSAHMKEIHKKRKAKNG